MSPPEKKTFAGLRVVSCFLLCRTINYVEAAPGGSIGFLHKSLAKHQVPPNLSILKSQKASMAISDWRVVNNFSKNNFSPESILIIKAIFLQKHAKDFTYFKMKYDI